MICVSKLAIGSAIPASRAVSVMRMPREFSCVTSRIAIREWDPWNREGLPICTRRGISKIKNRSKGRSLVLQSGEEEHEEKWRKTKDKRERERRAIKTSSVPRTGRKCLIAVRGSSGRWRNWFRGAYTAGKRWMDRWDGRKSGAGGFPRPRESVHSSIHRADN